MKKGKRKRLFPASLLHLLNERNEHKLLERRASALTIRSAPATDELPSSLPKQDGGGSGGRGEWEAAAVQLLT